MVHPQFNITPGIMGANETMVIGLLNRILSEERCDKVSVDGQFFSGYVEPPRYEHTFRDLLAKPQARLRELKIFTSREGWGRVRCEPKMQVSFTKVSFADLEPSAESGTVNIALSESTSGIPELIGNKGIVESITLYVPVSALQMVNNRPDPGKWQVKSKESPPVAYGQEFFTNAQADSTSTLIIKEQKMNDKTFMQSATANLTATSKSVVSDALDVATGMAAVEAIKQIAFSIMPIKIGFMGRLMGANSWVKDNAFVTLGIVTVVHTVLKSTHGRLTVNDTVMEVADNALRYATFKAVEALPINKLIQDLSEKLSKISGK